MYSQKWNCAVSFPFNFLHSCIRERFIYCIFTISPPILLQPNRRTDCGNIYSKSHIVHKYINVVNALGTRLRSFTSGNICFQFLIQCLCSAQLVQVPSMQVKKWRRTRKTKNSKVYNNTTIISEKYCKQRRNLHLNIKIRCRKRWQFSKKVTDDIFWNSSTRQLTQAGC